MGRGRLFFLFAAFTLSAHAVDVAFFIKSDAHGNIETYEAGTLYSHVAIRVGDMWLEARPWYGVRLTNEIPASETINEILHHPEIPEPNDAFLSEVLGKEYFLFADWHDPEVFNCTKLVAKYLGLDPNPMDFDPLLWGDRFHEYLGQPGLSVGELYQELKERSYQTKPLGGACFRALRSS